MKNLIKRFCLALVIAMGFTWSVSAQSITLNLKSPSCVYTGSSGMPPTCVNWTDTITGTYTSNPATNIGGGYWNKTYNDSLKYTGISFGEFVFSHLPAGPGASFNGYYWDGFTVASNGDNRNFGFADTTGHAGSVNWCLISGE